MLIENLLNAVSLYIFLASKLLDTSCFWRVFLHKNHVKNLESLIVLRDSCFKKCILPKQNAVDPVLLFTHAKIAISGFITQFFCFPPSFTSQFFFTLVIHAQGSISHRNA
jgi:hypothetical protein